MKKGKKKKKKNSAQYFLFLHFLTQVQPRKQSLYIKHTTKEGAHTKLQLSPHLKRTLLMLDLEPMLIQRNLITSVKTLFPNKATF